MTIPDKLYDVLKWVAILLLPATGTLYALLAQTWGLPYVEEVPVTLQGIATFIGIIIGVSTVGYNKGLDE